MRIGTEIAKEGFRWSGTSYGKRSAKRVEAEDKDRGDNPYASLPKSDTGFYPFKGRRGARGMAIWMGKDPRASYTVRIRAGIYDEDFPRRQYLQANYASSVIGQNTPTLDVLKVNGTVENPEIIETLIPQYALSAYTKPIVSFEEVLPPEITNADRWFPIYLDMIGAEKGKPSIWIDWMEVDGPIYDSESNFFGDLIRIRGRKSRIQGQSARASREILLRGFPQNRTGHPLHQSSRRLLRHTDGGGSILRRRDERNHRPRLSLTRISLHRDTANRRIQATRCPSLRHPSLVFPMECSPR